MKNIIIEVPANPLYIINRLEKYGFEGYVVGGCVRDSILGRQPEDWDITTNATPRDVMECFAGYNIVPTGLKHGTVTIIIDKEHIEVTTYRIDGDYNDHRRPDNVKFTPNLKEDLARRDFTINALAYNPKTGIKDYFNGLNDLENRVIKSVGVPEDRFREDALRILRCVRFASQLGFSIEEKTRKAMLQLLDTMDYVAAERIQVELNKAVMGDGFSKVFIENREVLLKIIPEMKPMVGFDQSTPYHVYDVFTHTLISVDYAIKNKNIRLAMLFHDIGKPSTFAPDDEGVGHFPEHGKASKKITNSILKRLKYSNADRKEITTLVEWHSKDLVDSKQEVLLWLNALGEDMFLKLIEVIIADNKAKEQESGKIQIEKAKNMRSLYYDIKREKLPYSIESLAVTGNDLILLGFTEGTHIGRTLNILLEKVMLGEIKNNKTQLLKQAEKLMK